jgi:hypothetical protein
MQGCLERGDEDLVVEAMDVLGEMVSMEQPLINDHVEVRACMCGLALCRARGGHVP